MSDPAERLVVLGSIPKTPLAAHTSMTCPYWSIARPAASIDPDTGASTYRVPRSKLRAFPRTAAPRAASRC